MIVGDLGQVFKPYMNQDVASPRPPSGLHSLPAILRRGHRFNMHRRRRTMSKTVPRHTQRLVNVTYILLLLFSHYFILIDLDLNSKSSIFFNAPRVRTIYCFTIIIIIIFNIIIITIIIIIIIPFSCSVARIIDNHLRKATISRTLITPISRSSIL